MNSFTSSSEQARYGRYLVVLLTTLMVSVLLVAAINITIDPFDVFRIADIPGINLQKAKRNADGARIATGFDILRGGHRTLFLGSSRTGSGMPDQDMTELAGNELLAGLAGAQIYEIVRALKLALHNSKLECVYLGLDFNGFSAAEKIKGAYWISPLSGDPIWLTRLKIALSLTTLRRSVQTLQANLAGADPVIEQRNAQQTFAAGEQRRMFEAMLRNWINVYRSAAYDPQRVAFLGVMLDRLTATGIQVIGLIHPLHAWQEEVFWRIGKADDYFRWRDDLTNLFARYSGRATKKPCAGPQSSVLWDFGGFQELAQRPAPTPQQTLSHPYFYETSHFYREVGAMMVKRTLGFADPTNFGTVLTPSNAAANKRAILQRRQSYLQQSVDSVALNRLFENYLQTAQTPSQGHRFFLTQADFEALAD